MSGVDRRDFNMTDFYNIVADARPVSDLDTSVVVVDIAFTDRSDVTDVMELLGDLNPRAVGLDVTFNEPKSDDERLLSALARIPNLVMAVGLSSNGPARNNQFVPNDYSYFYNQECDAHDHGAVNLPSKYDGATIRLFQVAYPLANGDTLPSMALALARLVDPKAAAKIQERGNRMETIDYPSRKFDVIPWFELPENAERVNGKIVLVGAIGELGDTHATPVEEKMAGVLIHAYAISTILRANYYRVASQWLTVGVSMLLCFLLCLTNIVMPLTKIKGLILRIVQLVGLYLIARIGYWMFIDHHFVFDFSYTLLMFAFGFFATDIWNGLVYIIKKLIKKTEMIKNLFTFLLLLTIGLCARADYSVESIDGQVQLLKHGQTTALSPGMILDPNDQVKIHNGSTLKILSSTESKIYTLTTPGIEKVARLIFQARREARSNAKSVNKQMRLTRNADNEGVVFVEMGKVTRSIAVYDPDGQNLKMDAGKLAESLLVHLRDSLGTASAAEEIALTRRIDPDGLSFMVENVLDHPIYFNAFKISASDGSVTISELGQPIGCYAILPTQFLAREQTAGLNPQELHLLLFTDFYFDIDEVLSKLNALLDAKTEINAPEGGQLYVMPM